MASLVDRLAADLRPASPARASRRLAAGLGAGWIVSAALTWAWLGPRPDLAQAVWTAPFWGKPAYTVAFGLAAGLGAATLMRPTGRPGRASAALAIPLGGVAAAAFVQLAAAPPALRTGIVLGGSAQTCPWLIALLSLPPAAGAAWAARALAPVRLRLAGLATGLTAGGAGATAYALHCTESAAPFVAVWYTLGMAVAGTLGALAGPRLLRW